MPMQCPVVETPIHEVRWANAGNNRLYMKRDDLQPFSFGGNKVRIAWEFLQDLQRKQADAMLLYGDRRSNLCRVLVGMCRIEGIPCRMIATSEHGTDTPSCNERILSLYEGVEVHTCDKEAIAEAVDEEMERFRAEGRTPYYIYGNRYGTGNEATAARAYAHTAGEILKWEQETGVTFDRIFVPCGTGATAGGLVAGFLERGISRPVVALSISSRPKERALHVLEETVRAYLRESEKSAHLASLSPEEWGLTCVTDYNGGGYGLVDERIRTVVLDMLLTNAIPLAPIYTGKAWAGMLSYLEEQKRSKERCLFLNTGGLPLFFDALTEGLSPLETL